MGMGAPAAWLWHKKNPTIYAMYCYPVAAGFIAGEGIVRYPPCFAMEHDINTEEGGIITAVLQVAGVSEGFYGSTVGCPAYVYCG